MAGFVPTFGAPLTSRRAAVAPRSRVVVMTQDEMRARIAVRLSICRCGDVCFLVDEVHGI